MRVVARRRSSVLSFDERWDEDADRTLEVIDPTTGAIATAAPVPAPSPAARRRRARAWTAAAVFLVSTILAAYAVVNRRAAVEMTAAWAAATTDADTLSKVIEGLRVSAMQADVSGEDPAGFVAARQASVRTMRARLDRQREAIRSARPIDPKLLSLRTDALETLDAWAAEMDAFLVRRGVWLRRPELRRLEAPVREATARWRVDNGRPPPVELAGQRFLDRLAKPSDEPLPFILTALTSSGHRLDVDLSTQRTVRTELADDGIVPLGAVASGLRIEGDRIIVATPGTSFARLPVEPSPDVEIVAGQPPSDEEMVGPELRRPPELRDAELAAHRHVTSSASDRSGTGRVAFAHVDVRHYSPDVATTLSVLENDGRVRDVVTVPSFVGNIAIAGDWIVFGRSGSVRTSVRAVHVGTGRTLTIRLPDPYITAFLVRPAP